jgi:hypothetical protein
MTWTRSLQLVAWILFFGSSGALAQTGANQALLRMERVQRGEAVCVLVQDNGSYRLEKMFRAKTEIYTGTLDAPRTEQLGTLLANERLQKLSQEEIHQPLITDTIDNIQLAIWRKRGWQELSFFAPESRKPHKETIDALLHWFHDLQKQHPGATQVEDPPTRCMPPSTNHLIQRVVTPDTLKSEPVAGDQAPYLFRLRSSHYYREAESTCTIVFADGSFHWESSHQAYGGKREDSVADGQLLPQAVDELRKILNSSDLQRGPTNPGLEKVPPFREGTFTVLSIPRENQVQNLFLSTAFNTLGNPKEVGGLSNMGYRVADEELLEPLRKWMKKNTDTHSKYAEKTALGNDCTTIKSAGTTERSPK